MGAPASRPDPVRSKPTTAQRMAAAEPNRSASRRMSRPHFSPKASIRALRSSNPSDDRLDYGGGTLSFMGRSRNAMGALARRFTVAKLIYSAISSLDGYVADEEGDFGWAVPDEEVHAFINDLVRPTGTYLYGRRMYEMMVGWETDPSIAERAPPLRDFPQSWQGGRPARELGA